MKYDFIHNFHHGQEIGPNGSLSGVDAGVDEPLSSHLRKQ
jgi:hypothetical protein